jgi:alpha-N-acetylglucosaminidase
MALNGVNLALAINGSEAIWQNTLRRIGYSDCEITDYISGPAYTAFWLMGVLENWGGPVTQRMIDEQVILQKKILARMRELGIQPVMQGFFGVVPVSLAQKFPTAQIIDQGPWNNFRRPSVLLPSDPLFARMAAIYYDESRKLYGPARFFGGDLFLEGGRTAGMNVVSVAAGVQNAMLRANPEAVWVLQAWQGIPTDELLQGLQRDRILVLDLDGLNWENRKGFNNSPWVWGLINNFGDNTGMFGNLKRIASEPPRALAGPYGRMMKGIGGIMEGINNNPVVYDLVFEMAWHNEAVDVRQWLHGYAEYRYGRTAPGLDHAWQLLLETVYSTAGRGESIFCARPSLQVKSVSTWGSTKTSYDPNKLEEAAREFLRAGKELGDIDAYQADAVNLVRQVVANRGLNVYHRMVSAYEAKDKVRFNQAADTFRMLIRDQDTLVGTRRELMLGNWLAEAKGMAATDEEKILFEKNARMLITYWGPDDTNAVARDYAYKEWSGLLQGFYLSRWDMFIRELNARLDGGTAQEPDYFAFEKEWTEQRNTYPTTPSGDPVATALSIFYDATASPK